MLRQALALLGLSTLAACCRNTCCVTPYPGATPVPPRLAAGDEDLSGWAGVDAVRWREVEDDGWEEGDEEGEGAEAAALEGEDALRVLAWKQPKKANTFTVDPVASAHPEYPDYVFRLFDGTDRMAAKITTVKQPSETFTKLSDLLDRLEAQINDDFMRLQHVPKMKKTKTFGRVSEEQHRVQVNAWLYATKMEPDEDWHCIVGTKPGTGTPRYLTCEVTGLTTSDYPADHDELMRARMAFFDMMNAAHAAPPTNDKYLVPSTPIPVRIEGSLFFDMDHKKGTVHAGAIKPDTAWEIHPVSSIVLRTH